MERMQKIARIVDKVLLVLRIIVIIFAVLSGFVLLGMILRSIPNLDIGINIMSDFGLDDELKIELIKLKLADSYLFIPHNVTGVLECGTFFLSMFVFLYEISILKKVFHPMEQGSPFDGTVSREIRKVAWIQLGWWIFGITAGNAMYYAMFYKSVDLPSLFSPDKVVSCKFSPDMDVKSILVFALLMLLSYVFRYGEELQKLSDETL